MEVVLTGGEPGANNAGVIERRVEREREGAEGEPRQAYHYDDGGDMLYGEK